MATLTRNKTFQAAREPLQNRQDLQLDANKVHGPLPFLNPTRADYDHVPVKPRADPGIATKGANEQELTQPTPGDDDDDDDEKTPEARYRWTSRNNRKGRHALVVKRAQPTPASPEKTPRPTAHPREILSGIRRMFTSFPVWDVSYDVAVTFTLGSLIWCLNAFFALLPFTNPKTEFKGEALYGGGITAFIGRGPKNLKWSGSSALMQIVIGATVFEIGSVLLMLEAVNANRTGCFGATASTPNTDEANVAFRPLPNDYSASERSWTWWPSMQELRTHYIHDIGFIACSALTFGATVFWISGFTALPGIYNYLSPQVVLDGVYWVPQVIGGIFFIFSGVLFTIETQKQWWKPAPYVLGWHVGSFSFLIGSIIQWYESLNKHPVEVEKP
ncbi:hypothetical protein KC320_g2296 [Hortaea werneckii]|nr:hypothetical protein KC320_g2296 [Hortaea werneckii]